MADEQQDDVTSDVEIKDSWLWIRDSKGYGSVTVTLVTVSFWATTLAYVLGLFKGNIFGLELRPFDPAASAAYFGMVLTLYGGRKWTEAHYAGRNGQ